MSFLCHTVFFVVDLSSHLLWPLGLQEISVWTRVVKWHSTPGNAIGRLLLTDLENGHIGWICGIKNQQESLGLNAFLVMSSARNRPEWSDVSPRLGYS